MADEFRKLTQRFDSALEFVELRGFRDEWLSLGMSDDDLRTLQNAIMSHPSAAPVVAGTGGLRKLRFALPKANVGKRGGVRVCYAFLPHLELVLLVKAYPKTEKSDLSAREKKAFKQLIERCEKHYSR
jgi:hypothetical protein